MKSNIKVFICLLLAAILYVYHGNAQTLNPGEEYSPDSVSEYGDTVTISKSDDDNTVLKWKEGREFAYMYYLDSLLRTQKNLRTDTVSVDENTGKINRLHKPGKDVSVMNQLLNSLPVQIFFWTLAIVFIAVICYKVLFKNGIFSRRNKKQTGEKEEDASGDLSDLSNYDSLVSQAEKENNFNLATRYLFLQTLKNLSDKGFVNFAPDKTNSEYLTEMKANEYVSEFAWLTRNYEYLWYGKFSIGADTYSALKEKFNVFNKKV